MDKELTKKYLTAPIVTVGDKEYVGISEMIEQVVWNA